jgi:hypothetical protein
MEYQKKNRKQREKNNKKINSKNLFFFNLFLDIWCNHMSLENVLISKMKQNLFTLS